MNHIYKIIFITILTVISVPSYAGIQMCSANDAVTIVLDPSIAFTSYNIYNNVSTWKEVYPYGTIIGRSACLSSRMGLSNSAGLIYDGLLEDNNKVVVGGEKNGSHCFCKITHPVSSKWIFMASFVVNSGCYDACTSYCHITTASYKERLFNSAN